MTQLDPILAVRDVEASSRWYQALLQCKSLHGGKTFEVLVSEEGTILLCLHKWGAHGHPTMQDPEIMPGNGLLLYFRTGQLSKVRENAAAIGAHIEEELHLNTASTKMEFSLRDPDGYYITISDFHTYKG